MEKVLEEDSFQLCAVVQCFHRGPRFFLFLFCHPQRVGCLMTSRVPNILSSYVYVQWKNDSIKKVLPYKALLFMLRGLLPPLPLIIQTGPHLIILIILWVFHMITCGLVWTWIPLADLAPSWYSKAEVGIWFSYHQGYLDPSPEQNWFLSAEQCLPQYAYTYIKCVYIPLKRYKDFLKLIYESSSTPHLYQKSTNFCLNSFFKFSYGFWVIYFIHLTKSYDILSMYRYIDCGAKNE